METSRVSDKETQGFRKNKLKAVDKTIWGIEKTNAGSGYQRKLLHTYKSKNWNYKDESYILYLHWYTRLSPLI